MASLPRFEPTTEVEILGVLQNQAFGRLAESHSDKVEAVRQFTRDHAYSFGAASSANHFDDYDSRDTAASDAAKLGIH